MSSKRVACCAGVEVLNFYLLASQLAGGVRRTAVGVTWSSPPKPQLVGDKHGKLGSDRASPSYRWPE